jgi:site-specific DNA recombinase
MPSATAVRPLSPTAPAPEATRRAAMVVRVSTTKQAENDEGSLKNQLQRLRAHLDYRRACGEDWQEVAVYELKGISGKSSLRSPELQRLVADIQAGRVNTVCCTELSRVSRSVLDFLNFFTFLTEQGAEFVCLKGNYDTTSPQGKFLVTVMLALGELEREQTAERTKDAMAARSERGLWNGGQLLGYDLDAAHKGHLQVNPQEAEAVRFAFQTYLECGSLAGTAQRLNERGYRTKSYVSRNKKDHPGVAFRLTTVQFIL